MADASSSFSNLVPGFDFLQSLVKNASAALPAMGQWVAPTLNPEELEKRIQELKTVQFWLEQNARMLGATIQALEVQRMTLSTLKTMNVQMGDLREAMTIRMPAMPTPAPKPKPEPVPAPAPEPVPEPEVQAEAPAEPAAADKPAAGVVDPMKWWGALTQQFTELAASAMKEGASSAASGLAGVIAKQAFPGAGKSTKAKAEAQAPAARKVAAKKRKTAPRKRAEPSR